MKVDEGKYSIAELIDWYGSKTLVPNKEYQRGSGLWPPSAKSYFIDTILKGYPFPKVYFHERLDMRTKRPHREIVDGQQRISTIAEFAANGFQLGINAESYQGKRFEDLTPEQQENFYSYTVSVDSECRPVRNSIHVPADECIHSAAQCSGKASQRVLR